MAEPIGIFGAGWVGLVTGACFAELGHDVVVRDVVPEKIDGARAAARCRSTSPGSPSCSSATASGSRFTLDVADVARRLPSSSSSASTRRRRTRATPTSRASGRCVDELPELDGPRDRSS